MSQETRKRRYNVADDESIPAVERLYRSDTRERSIQPSYASAGGFVVDEENEFARFRTTRSRDTCVNPDVDKCEKCGGSLTDSFLWEKFTLPVCDLCKDMEEEHKLLSRTQVKDEYLLKDEDLDIRKPPLRYLSKKNPHNPRYGDMKLYVKKQIVDRMLLVHGTWGELAEKKELRREAKERRAESAFDKKIKEMRTHMRGACEMKAKAVQVHEHLFGEEKCIGEDEYSKTCTTCEYVVTYEKI